HLFQFLSDVATLKGGKSGMAGMLKRAVQRWYHAKSDDDLAYELIKYRDREGYTHKRVLQLAHPTGNPVLANNGGKARIAMYRWARGLQPRNSDENNALPLRVHAHIKAMKAEAVSEVY